MNFRFDFSLESFRQLYLVELHLAGPQIMLQITQKLERRQRGYLNFSIANLLSTPTVQKETPGWENEMIQKLFSFSFLHKNIFNHFAIFYSVVTV